MIFAWGVKHLYPFSAETTFERKVDKFAENSKMVCQGTGNTSFSNWPDIDVCLRVTS